MKFHSFASSRCRRRGVVADAHRARERDASASRAPSWVEKTLRGGKPRERGARDEETRRRGLTMRVCFA